MDTIIGLGYCGCKIANLFSRYPQYKIYKIDTQEHEGNSFLFPEKKHPEKYEEECPNFSEFLKDIKGPVLFVVGGGGYISASSLKILFSLKHCKINILYIQPDLNLISGISRQQECITFNVLQEYARSGVFDRIFLVSNSSIERALGDTPIAGYYNKLNEMIVSTMHMINVYDHTKSILDSLSDPLEISRILTLGLIDLDKGEEKLFFPLKNIRERRFYYAINHKTLETDGKLLRKIKNQMHSMTDENKIKVNYGIFETNYENNYCYSLVYSSVIQE